MTQTIQNYLVSQFGMPLYGIGGLPPYTGNYFWVNPGTGNDANTGGPQDPFASLGQALTAAVAGNNDVIFLSGNVNNLSTTLTWSKSNTHLIGISAAPLNGAPPRIGHLSTVTPFTPLVNVTGTGCMFSNFSVVHGFGSTLAQIAWAEAGGANQYKRVQFLGMADAASISGSVVAARSITVGGLGNNLFEECVFGLDMIPRGAGNSTVEFRSTTNRNTFKNSIFQAVATTGAALHFSANSSGAVLGWQMFDCCQFINPGPKQSVPNVGSTLSGVAIMSATVGGIFLLRQCTSVGATKWEASASNFLFVDGGAPVSTTTGYAINNA